MLSSSLLLPLLASGAFAMHIPRYDAYYSPAPGKTPGAPIAQPTPQVPKHAVKPTPPPSTNPICVNQADPDNDVPDQCVCSSGSSYTTVGWLTSGTESGCALYTTYPSTGAPPAATFSPGPQTNTGFFTTTEGIDVIVCTSTLVTRSENWPVTQCLGSSYTISQLPHATVQQALSTQNVGTMAGTELYSIVSSALASVCPLPPSGTVGACTADATITGVAYTFNTTTYTRKRSIDDADDHDELEGDLARPLDTKAVGFPGSHNSTNDKRMCCDGIGEPVKQTVIRDDGTLTISVPTSNYTSDNLDALIILVASTFGGGAQGSMCQSYADVRGDGPARLVRRQETIGNTTLCGAVGFAGVEYMDESINPDAPAAFLAVELSFQEGMAEQLAEILACTALADAASALLGLILGPEWALLGKLTSAAVDYACKEELNIG